MVLLALVLVAPALAQAPPRLPVGISGRLTDVVLPGPELEAAPIDSSTSGGSARGVLPSRGRSQRVRSWRPASRP